MHNGNHKHADPARILVLHPQYPADHLLMWDYVSNEQAFYVRFEGEYLSFELACAQLEQATATQNPDWDRVEYLVLDECDRIEDPALKLLVEQMLGKARQAQIVIVSRVAPVELIEDGVLREQIRLQPVNEALMLHDYVEHINRRNLLEVRAFGCGHVVLNGRPIVDWDGLLPRSLFFFLVDRGMVTRDVIFETFWPTMNAREATNVFHVTKRKITEVLGIDLTIYSSGYYRISPEIELSYDVSRFNSLIQESDVAVSAEDHLELLEQAVALQRGRFLSGMNTPWVLQRRAELAQAAAEAFEEISRGKELIPR